MCSAVGGVKANRRRGGGHTDGGAQSAIAPPWFCDKSGAGDGCRGHLFFYSSIGMLCKNYD
jgi:hypothetical protein